jgi:hypothetical protein
MLLPGLCEFAADRVDVPAHNEVAAAIPAVGLPGSACPIDNAVQGRIPALLNLPPLGRHRVRLVPIPNLTRAKILGNGTYPVADVLAPEIEWGAIIFNSAQSYVNVRVFGIEMWDSNPVQARPQILFHPADEITTQLVQVDSFAEFRRYDHFPESQIAGFLPLIENISQPDAVGLVPKNAGLVA